jgi:hypothetical protein
MMNDELPQEMKDKVLDWLGEHEVLHFWEMQGTFLVVCKTEDGSVFFLRLWRSYFGDMEIMLSSDKVIA